MKESKGYNKGKSNSNWKHGMTKTRIWNIWCGMKARCSNKNAPSYSSYGGRGIKICPEWMKFFAFYTDMKDGYSDDLTLERINVHGDYCKGNCTWISIEEQSHNKTNNIEIEVDGEMVKVFDLAKKHGLRYETLWNRLFTFKMPLEIALQSGRVKRRWAKKPKDL